jgi:zinc transport system substrate-binding protein
VRRRLTALLAGCALLGGSALVSGCAGTPDDGRPRVVASAYPFAWLAGQVAGPDAAVSNLARSGAEPHDIELSPRQVASLHGAAVVVYLRGFQSAVDDALPESPRAARLDLGPVMGVRRTADGLDPHVWLDPVRMASAATALGDRLALRDPAHADGYRARAAATAGTLRDLDGLFRSRLTGCARTDIVTAHEAFSYLAERYGLTQVGVTGLSPDAEPTPSRLAEVARYAREHDVTTVFFEQVAAPQVARTVAGEVGASVAVLSPVEAVDPPDDYPSVMRRNAAALSTALGCR